MAAKRSRPNAPASSPASAPAATRIPPPAPVITLTTDFGHRDPFVGIMKGVMLGIAPVARFVDLTHEVPAQNVVAAAFALASAARWFPTGTIHVAVVDPGVGTTRRALLVETADAFFVGPDNGVLSLAAPGRTVRRIIDVTRSRHRLPAVSATFQGRDVFAPIAAALASGIAAERLGRVVDSMVRVRLPRPRRTGRALVGEVLWVDGFGNLTTNIGVADIAGDGFRGQRLSTTIGGHVAPFRRTYADVPAGRPVALVNSTDLLEIAVNRASAAERFGASTGTHVRVEVE